MVAAAEQQQQQPQPQPASTTSAEEEALKRNTDCVYFLASPLTCKKGSECEYRHSEYARVNPRDCYYWLNGNCLNPKCGFRHPPLDGLLGTQTLVSPGPSSTSHPAVTPAQHAPYNSGKQAVPCIFFQKGLCLKGDRCAFSHGPSTTNSKAPKPMTSAAEPPSLKKAFGSLEKCTQEQNIPSVNVPKAVGVPAEVKPAPSKTVVGNERSVPQHTGLDNEVCEYEAASFSPIIDGGRSGRLHQPHLSDDHGVRTGKDADEFYRENSPGFDVLVDDELRDSDYYHAEDQYGKSRGHEGRNLNSVNEYDIGHSADYDSVADIDREMYRDPLAFDSYNHMQGQYGWEQHRTSSERMLLGPSHVDRRGYPRAESPIDESDLRYRLSKQRRTNGLRSVVSHDYVRDNQVEERSYRGSSQRDAPQESSLSNRLRGRIKLPGRSPVNGSDPRSERDMDRGRNPRQLSPARQQGRLRDRITTKVEEDYGNNPRNFRGPLRARREITDEQHANFAGPKSLAELKVVKNVDDKKQRSLGKRKYPEGDKPSDLSFEGPMPLSEILKRKRGASSANKEDNPQRESNNNNKADVVETEEKELDITVGETSKQLDASELEIEEGVIADDEVEDHQYEGGDQRDGDGDGDGDYEYEQGDEGDYNYDEGENADPEEYIDDEEGDEFAKKIGVMFS